MLIRCALVLSIVVLQSVLGSCTSTVQLYLTKTLYTVGTGTETTLNTPGTATSASSPLTEASSTQGGSTSIQDGSTSTQGASASSSASASIAPDASDKFDRESNVNHVFNMFASSTDPPLDPVNYLQLNPADTLEECELKCFQEPSCIGYSYFPDTLNDERWNRACYGIKNRKSLRRVPHTPILSGTLKSANANQLVNAFDKQANTNHAAAEYALNQPDKFINAGNVADENACMLICDADDRCLGYTFVPTNRWGDFWNHYCIGVLVKEGLSYSSQEECLSGTKKLA